MQYKVLPPPINYINTLGIKDCRVLHAFKMVPRDLFVPEEYKFKAYEDICLPIGEGQTISQPSLVALMTGLLELKEDETVLEIGTGSGFQAAVLSYLAKKVYTVERIASLASKAKKILGLLHCSNVHVTIANGTIGLPHHAPYDAIIVTAGAPNIPQPLIDQLKLSGRIVIPVGESPNDQKLIVGVKSDHSLETQTIEDVRFVPLVGKFGWKLNQKKFR